MTKDQVDQRPIILSAKELHKSYYTPSKIEILQKISLVLRSGESAAITGRSGEGKSTLLHILGTLEKPCSGSLVICGKSVDTHPLSSLRNAHIGFIFQTFNLLEDYSVLENVLMPARIGRQSANHDSRARQRALELLAEVGLDQRAHFPAKLLSGGEKQRAAIARALINDPEILLADEPSGNLDSSNSQIIHELLLGCCRIKGKALIVVTHDQELANLTDHRYLLKEGVLT